MNLSSVIVGWGAYLPEKIVTNDDVAKIVDTSDEWITERTGIKQRHFASDGEYTSDLATKAAEEALRISGIDSKNIDLIIVATATSDLTMPSVAAIVHQNLSLGRAIAFDMNAACSGFLYALTTADSYIKAGIAKNAIVIGAETLSRLINWEDRGTCILFGDGAGAVVLQAGEESGQGVLGANMFCDGDLSGLIKTSGGVSTTRTAGLMEMQGQEVFKNAVTKMSDSLLGLLKKLDMDVSQIDWLIPHQANSRILMSIASRIEISVDKVVSTVEKHANTSAASIPLALATAINDGRIKRGDILALQALGSGLTWGASIIKF